MEHKKLSKSEISKLKELIDRYSKLWEIVDQLENKLNLFEKEKALILIELNKTSKDLEYLRSDESKYRKSLSSKYGEIVLDLETFEYKPS